ncbi:MAG TPA: hypothetical protein VHX37_02760 [Acidobacteriaceae bacterium]|jgi:hypothetical protein|nr:hypothetical protein [Acidobacteriaceae bacterium]
MANMNIPQAERNLTPAQVGALDKRRQKGLMFQVLSGQFAFFAVLLLLWTGQDLTYDPGWVHPMFYYNVATGLLAVVFGIWGTHLRKGRIHEY